LLSIPFELRTFYIGRSEALDDVVSETEYVHCRKMQHVSFLSGSGYEFVDVSSEMLPSIRAVFVRFSGDNHDEGELLVRRRLEALSHIRHWMSEDHKGRIQFNHSSLSN
jgi:hypothetical protein